MRCMMMMNRVAGVSILLVTILRVIPRRECVQRSELAGLFRCHCTRV